MRETYQTAWEYNDFYMPEVLADVKRRKELIDFYAKIRGDFSQDVMHGAFLDVVLHSEDPLIREVGELRVRQSMNIAKEMGLRGVVFHTGALPGYLTDVYRKNWQQKNEQFFRTLLEEYPDQYIFLENMFDKEPYDMLALAQRLSDIKRFALCLDYGHVKLFGTDMEEWVKNLAPYIKHMHINDNDFCRDLHLDVGGGKLDWQVFDRQMKQYQVDATVLIEVSGIERQQKSLEYLKQHNIWPMLRKEG